MSIAVKKDYNRAVTEVRALHKKLAQLNFQNNRLMSDLVRTKERLAQREEELLSVYAATKVES